MNKPKGAAMSEYLIVTVCLSFAVLYGLFNDTVVDSNGQDCNSLEYAPSNYYVAKDSTKLGCSGQMASYGDKNAKDLPGLAKSAFDRGDKFAEKIYQP